jgi:membrane associated rhomboid family serine protease
MIADRDYLRRPEGWNVRVSLILIWILGACFLIQTALTVVGRVPVVGALGLSRTGMSHWEIWRLLTFQFLHEVPWPLHVISNALGLYFFGRTVEEITGPKRFLAVYLVGGVAGGLAQLALDYAVGRSPAASLIGASAGVSAIVAIFCRLHAQQVFSFILFVFPVRMRAITFLLLLIGGSVLGLLFPTDAVAHMAHLGGIAFGYFIVPVLHGELPWAGWMGYREPSRRVVIPFPRDEVRRSRSAPPTESEEDEDFVAREIDPILEKINAQGIQSLTDRERRALERARERIRRS